MTIQFTPAEAADQVSKILMDAIEKGQLKQLQRMSVCGMPVFIGRCPACGRAQSAKDDADGLVVWAPGRRDDDTDFATKSMRGDNKAPYCRGCAEDGAHS